MGKPFSFQTFAAGNFPAADWDQTWDFTLALTNIFCTATGTNSIALTPIASSPSVTAYQSGMKLTFLAGGTNSGATVLSVGSLAALTVFDNTGVALVGGEIGSGNYTEVVFDQTLSGGSGGFRLNTPGVPAIVPNNHIATGNWAFSNNSVVADSPITINRNTVNTASVPAATLLHMVGADGAQCVMTMDATSGLTSANVFRFRMCDNTAASPAATPATAIIGQFGWTGHNGTSYVTGNKAIIAGIAVNTWSGSDNSTQLDFYVTPTASTSVTKSMTLQNGGNLELIVGNLQFDVAAKTVVLKQGANGTVGTFVANGATAVVVSNTNVAISDAIIFSMNTVGGTPAGAPFLSAISAGTSFSVKAAAGDTSTYNYAIIKNAA